MHLSICPGAPLPVVVDCWALLAAAENTPVSAQPTGTRHSAELDHNRTAAGRDSGYLCGCPPHVFRELFAGRL